jgi:integrase
MPRCGVAELLGYIPPEYHDNKSGSYIDYYVKHPQTGKLERKRVKLNKLHGNIRKATARQLVAELTERLKAGWNPFDGGTEVRASFHIGKVLDDWDRAKTRQLRHSSPYSYTSFTNVLRRWLGPERLATLPVHEFNRSHAVDFMSYVSDERLVSNTTYNNYLVYFSMLFKWMVERNFRRDNPFEGFSRRKEVGKSRTYLTEQDRIDMAEWIKANDPVFWMACMFIYGTLIRPGELARLRVHHVDIERQVVMLPAEDTKSGVERTPAIPDWMAAELRAMELHKQPGKAWLLGPRLQPSEKKIARNALNRHWVTMRKALGWPPAKQLYSLRDTGIIQLLRDGVDLLHVRDQAGHTDIATTNRYLKHAFPHGHAEVRTKATPLQATTPFVVGAPLYSGGVDDHKEVPRFAALDLDSTRSH